MKHYSIILLLLLATAAEARPRSEAQMRQAAAEVLSVSNQEPGAKSRSQSQLKTLARHEHLTVMGYGDGGFAVVTADDLLPAVVGYSDKTYADEALPEGFSWWLRAMNQAADYYILNHQEARVAKPDANQVLPYVRPLLSTEWGQEEPFNNACPLLPDDELYPRHCVVGCVATATAQILNYHQWPTTGQGTASLQVPYGDPRGQTLTMDFSACYFDWANMRNTYTVGNYTEAEARAVADLSHAMGMMAQMQYGIDFSGAMSEDARDGLRDNFGITTATYYARGDLFGFGDNYSEREWSDMVFRELSTVGPVYYAGADADNQGGHAFVLDGYNADGLVHVNWGWHGRFDGYYDISILNPRIYHFSKQQEMILGICPPAQAKGLTEVFSLSEAGTLADEIEAVRTVAGGNFNLTGVRVEGPVNADDLHVLATTATLTNIDLSGATLDGDLLPPYAFYGCRNLRTLLLPATMRFYGDGALAGCSNLNRLNLPAGDGQGYVARDGVLYSPDGKEVLAVLPTAPDTVTVAEGVTRLHPHAFEGCKYVRIVTLPRSLDVVGERALADVLIMRELHVLGLLPAEATASSFSGVDPGFLKLCIPAGSRAAYAQAEGWAGLFRSDNVYEEGTLVRARNLTRPYGQDTGEYYYEIVGQRVKGLPVLTCEATKDSPAGVYTIEVHRGTIEADDVQLQNGTLTITGSPTGLDGQDTTADAPQTFTLGYCCGAVATTSQWGAQGNGHVSAAIYVPAQTLAAMAGADITQIRAGLATRLNIDELSVWLRTSPDGENLAEGKLNRKQSRVQQGWNEVSLSTPFTIPADCAGLYIGYTYHHTSLSRAVSVVGTTPEHTAFVKLGDDEAWQDLSAEGAISIEAVVSGQQLPRFDLALQRASLTPALAEGTTAYKLTADVANMGTDDVTGFDLTIAAEDISNVSIHIDQPVGSGRQQTVSATFRADAAIAATADIAISSLDDGADANADNNTATATLAFERNVLIEEFTTESCPNCPGGAATMHEALTGNARFDGRVSLVCHHSAFNTDWLTQPCDQDYVWFFNEGGQTFAPAWMFDRQPEFESMIASGNRQAIYWTNSAKEFAQTLGAALGVPAHAMIGARATTDDGRLTVVVNGLRDELLTLSDARLTVYVTEDNIAARDQQGTDAPFTHQHVIRAYNSTWGEAVSWQGDTFSRTLIFDLDADWKTADLKVVATLGNYDAADNLNCRIENTTTAAVRPAEASGIAVVTWAKPASDGAFSLDGRYVGRTYRGLIVSRQADGTFKKTFKNR